MAKAAKKVLIVLTVLMMSIGILCACDKSNEYPQEKGKLYKLSEAYEQGLISRNDLLNIYFYYTGNELDGLEIIEKSPVELDEQTVQDIKESWVYTDLYVDSITKEEVDEIVTIEKYLGTYNGYVALYITGWKGFFQMVTTIEIDGITFNYRDTNEIRVWKKN